MAALRRIRAARRSGPSEPALTGRTKSTRPRAARACQTTRGTLGRGLVHDPVDSPSKIGGAAQGDGRLRGGDAVVRQPGDRAQQPGGVGARVHLARRQHPGVATTFLGAAQGAPHPKGEREPPPQGGGQPFEVAAPVVAAGHVGALVGQDGQLLVGVQPRQEVGRQDDHRSPQEGEDHRWQQAVHQAHRRRLVQAHLGGGAPGQGLQLGSRGARGPQPPAQGQTPGQAQDQEQGGARPPAGPQPGPTRGRLRCPGLGGLGYGGQRARRRPSRPRRRARPGGLRALCRSRGVTDGRQRRHRGAGVRRPLARQHRQGQAGQKHQPQEHRQPQGVGTGAAARGVRPGRRRGRGPWPCPGSTGGWRG